jgi:hypothetical protein
MILFESIIDVIRDIKDRHPSSVIHMTDDGSRMTIRRTRESA